MNKMFSFVIPAYNEEKYLLACLESIVNQIGGFDYEIIVVDNNSIDRTAIIAREFGVEVIGEKKQGVGQARKTGTEKADGTYIVHLDADSRLSVDYIQKAYNYFQKDNKLVCLGGWIKFYDAGWCQNFLRITLQPVLHIFTFVFSRGCLGPMGNNMVFKKEIYNKTSGFDSDLCYGEDADLAKKMSMFGKVRLFKRLQCDVSARRFNFNDKNFWIYVLNFFSIFSKKYPYNNTLPRLDEDELTK